jgi:transaldolase
MTSIRNPRQTRECAIANSDIATIPFPVMKKILTHEKTIEGLKKFRQDIVPEYRKLFE